LKAPPEEIPQNLPYQPKVKAFYETNPIQLGVAGLIFANFFVSAGEAQVVPDEGSEAEFVFYVFEIIFNFFFTVELIINMYGSWFLHFWESAWNWFDFVIVTISLMAMILTDLPGISVLRLFRAFRVFRLFKRIKSLRVIIEGVGASLPGVGNAFVVLGILMGIWSIMGVEFYGKDQPLDFGNFGRAMFTMWQVMTGDSWASMIARPLLYDGGHLSAAPFFVSYIFIAGIVMTNVVVAILLEKYLKATGAAAAEDQEEAERAELAKEEAEEAELRALDTDDMRAAAQLKKQKEDRIVKIDKLFKIMTFEALVKLDKPQMSVVLKLIQDLPEICKRAATSPDLDKSQSQGLLNAISS